MGREWNEKLLRMMSSISRASDHGAAGKILITDIEGHRSDMPRQVLVEVLAADESCVLGQFLVVVKRHPKPLRYREPATRWPRS